MCGIAGQISFDEQPSDRAVVARMCDAIRHRGPDSQGIHAERRAALGIQRLRVIDLVHGDQPVWNEARNVVVVLNGEIYNFRELRSDLVSRGHRFRTAGDTETIVHLYEEYGDRCVERLHGMFAFALWDVERQRLLVARDRVGKKPLFYAHRGSRLSFSSEVASLLEDPAISRDLDPQALDAYFAYRWVPSPRSAFRDIRKLPPASRLVFEEGREPHIDRYWHLDFGRVRAVDDDRELHEELRQQLRAAVRRRLVSDVPLGAFLSGGVDSAAVVAAMAEESSGAVRTFSIGFANEEYNELPAARLVAERFETEHHEFVVEPNAVELIPKIVRHFGEPFADASAVPSFCVAEMASRHVTVALNGDGGDETFGGYTRYVANRAAAAADVLPRALMRSVAQMSARIPTSGRKESWTSRVRRLGATLGLDPAERYIAYMTRLNGLDRDRLYTDEYRRWVNGSIVDDVLAGPWAESSATNLVDRMLDTDTRTYLPDDLLTKMDIASMAYSLEARSPLLDHEFMQFAATLPSDYKVRGRKTKVGLKAALRGWVPDEILDAPKRGFRLPIHDWFRGDLQGYAREVLLDPAVAARGEFDMSYVDELLTNHAAGRADHAQGIWTLLMYELWRGELVD